MQVSDQHQAMATLVPAYGPPSTYWTWGSAGPRGGLAPVKNIKPPCLCQTVNPQSFSPLSLLVTTVTELSQLLDSPEYQPHVITYTSRCQTHGTCTEATPFIAKAVFILLCNCVYRYSSYDIEVNVVTCYRLDGPGIESQWGRDFPCLSRPAPKPTQPPVQRLPGLLREVKSPGHGANQQSTSSVEITNGLALHLSLHSVHT